jgi:FMN phosphatase YigB (HAD superfamily)
MLAEFLRNKILNKKIFLDFDGVLVDSAFEAFRVASACGGYIQTPFDASCDDRYSSFLKLRLKVAPAWNYYYVIREIFGTSVQKHKWVFTEEAKDFEMKFLKTRDAARKNRNKEWLSLHRKYFDLTWLNNLDCAEIVTNKPKNAVIDLLNFYGCCSLASRVFDRSDWPDCHRKQSFIEARIQSEKVDSAIFVDDHAATLADLSENQQLVVKSFQASWGYSEINASLNAITVHDFKPLILDFVS